MSGISKQELDKAIGDLALIRRVIERANPLRRQQASRESLEALLLIQAVALTFAVVVLAMELVTSGQFSKLIFLSKEVIALRWQGIINIGVTLLILLALMYYWLRLAARRSGQELEAFLAENFIYLQNISFLSDLLIKFVAISLVVMAGRPEWLSPLLTLFIGDYLLQGRFFEITLKLRAALGVLSVGIALLQFWQVLSSILLPFGVLLVVLIISMSTLLSRRSVLVPEGS